MAWWQLKLTVSGEQAQTYSTLLQALDALSVTLQDAADDPIFEPELDKPQHWQTSYVIALFADDCDPEKILRQLLSLSRADELPTYQIEQIADKAWERAWMDDFQPMAFGQRLWICPTWCEAPDPRAVNIILDPGLAFGTGTHATTAMCLQWLDQHDVSEQTVIDYGCGSGVLGIAACKLGAKQVYAIDTSEQALTATLANAETNHIATQQLITLSPEQLPDNLHTDVLLANILAKPLIELAPRFAQLLPAQGKLVLSGILAEQQAMITDHYQQWFAIENVVTQAEWVCIHARRLG